MVSLCRPRGLLFVILAGVARKIALGHGTLGIRPLPFPPKPATAFGREHLRWGGIVFSKWMSITLGGLGIYGLYQPFIAKWLFVFNSNFLRMKEAHRSASPSRERFDHPHPPPLVLNADARKSVNCDEPNRNRRTTIAIHLTSDAAALTSHRKPGCAGGRASAETDFAARITSPNTGAPASMRNSAWIIFDCRPESVSNCST